MFGTSPAKRYAGSSVSIIMHYADTFAFCSTLFQPDLWTSGAQTGKILDDFGERYGWNDFSTACDDRVSGERIGFGVPPVLV